MRFLDKLRGKKEDLAEREMEGNDNAGRESSKQDKERRVRAYISDGKPVFKDG